MRFSRLLGKTLREVPVEAEIPSHQLLLRAGMIHQVTAGIYSYLPLGWRVLRKIEHIIRQELAAIGGQELAMPVLQPIEIWQETGRDLAFGQSLFTLKDRRGRELCLGPTHEEVITGIVSRNVHSYRDLPLLLYQIQTKFRDEPRPRGGLLRVREFGMMDLYSFDTDEEASAESYQKMLQAYKNIYERCGLPTIVVEADSGAIGGKESHEFTLLTDSGEDEIIYCSSCDYAANVERAESIKPRLLEEKSLPIEEVATPGKKTIEEVAEFLKVPKERTLKAVFYSADGELVFVVIRGDMDVNEVKLKNALGCYELRLASDEEVQGAGLVAGSASPLGLSGVRVVADDSITMGSNFIAGANKPNHHLRNVNYPRDFEVDMLLDIAKARAEQRCPRCGSKLLSRRGIEVGHTFKLGTTFSEKLGAYYLGRDGERKPIFMGCYGIGTGRLVAAAIEQNHDEKGIIWLHSIAPYQVHLCALSMNDPQVLPAVEELYSQLEAEGLEVLYDDRRESAGVKFNDADLLGIPIRLVISSRSLRSQSVELKWRTERKSQSLPLDGIVSKLKELLTPNSL